MHFIGVNITTFEREILHFFHGPFPAFLTKCPFFGNLKTKKGFTVKSTCWTQAHCRHKLSHDLTFCCMCEGGRFILFISIFKYECEYKISTIQLQMSAIMNCKMSNSHIFHTIVKFFITKKTLPLKSLHYPSSCCFSRANLQN